MIRDKNKIYGEANDENTVLKDGNLAPDSFVIMENKKVKTLTVDKQQLLYINGNGEISSFQYKNSNRAIIGTDSLGQLSLTERLTLPSTPPPNRDLVLEVYGSYEPDGPVIELSDVLEAPHWYEIEVVGAGGGGGAGVINRLSFTWPYSINGANGGDGGYYKCLVGTSINRPVTMKVGCPGGAGGGWVRGRNNNGDYYISGSNVGGKGGKQWTPFPNEKGNSGNGDIGGKGIGLDTGYNLGADGGDTCINVPLAGVQDELFGGAGGGSVGRGGGNGGDFLHTNDEGYIRGSGGGAGGGYGGIGGDGSVDKINEVTVRAGAIGLGGAGGGNGHISYFPGDFPNGSELSGGGGGGGGGSYFSMPGLTVFAGGGGGGAGGGDWYGAAAFPGSNGYALVIENQLDAEEISGVAANKGIGGSAVKHDLVLENGDSYTTIGHKGNRGRIRIWRRVN